MEAAADSTTAGGMVQRRVGRSGLTVSRLGLGTLSWGAQTDPADAAELLTVFADAGGTLVDTAPHYGDGHAEELLGTLLHKTVRRDEMVVATKAGIGLRGQDLVVDTSRRALLDTLDLSLARLDTDHVDLWQVHVFDPAAALDETLSALDHALASGRTRYVGVSNHAGWQLARTATLQESSPAHARIVSDQVEYSLLNRGAEAEVLPAAAARGVGVLAWAPLGGGVLTGKYRSGTPVDSRAGRTDVVDRYLTPTARRVVDALATAAKGLNATSLEVALAWVRDRPGVSAAIVGARTTAQLREVLAAEKVSLPAEIRTALDDISAV
jgi:aryl-alcohol dehydrogenase-like predicted oxidoreductase